MSDRTEGVIIALGVFLFSLWWVYLLSSQLKSANSWLEHYKLQATNLKSINDNITGEYQQLSAYSENSNKRLISESDALKLENQKLKSQIEELYHIKERLSKIKSVIDA